MKDQAQKMRTTFNARDKQCVNMCGYNKTWCCADDAGKKDLHALVELAHRQSTKSAIHHGVQKETKVEDELNFVFLKVESDSSDSE